MWQGARMTNEHSAPEPTSQPSTVVPPPPAESPPMTPPAPNAPPQSQNGWMWNGTEWVPDPARVGIAPHTQQPRSNALVDATTYTIFMVLAWGLALLSFGYMLPWAVAVTRRMPNHGAIALLNLLLGWTIVGWIIALVMACSQRRV